MAQQTEAEFCMNSAISPAWKRPDEVMKLHRLKQKKRALQARMNKTDLPQVDGERYFNIGSEAIPQKRKNPFSCQQGKRVRNEDMQAIRSSNLDLSSDNTLFQLLSPSTKSQSNIEHLQTSFASVLSQLSRNYNEVSNTVNEKSPKGETYIPIDWSLKTKVRFMSPKPFAWSQKLRTCEEASGITGFVRCLDTGLDASKDPYTSRSLDTSPNARFHQCCLVWQHPALPWLELFPRSATRLSSTTSSMISSSQNLRDALHREWGESFRSLFQLTRAQQCPYFYVCANSFTCLFRAAGILGFTDIHALLTPTTRGFRHMLKEEDVVYMMPLRKSTQSSLMRLSSESASDTGYETLDSVIDDQSQMHSSTSMSQHADGLMEGDDDDDDDDDESPDEWLESRGVAAEEIRRIKSKQVKLEQDKEKEVDRTPESLIYVEGVEAQALFNFLMNCKSSTATTGPLAGVPPTLLAPVAFHGATLKSLKVRQSVVKVDMENFHSMELRGPILPHALQNLCSLLEESLDEFSATFANLESTRPFSLVTNVTVDNPETNESVDCMKSPEKSSSYSTSVQTPSKAFVPAVFGKENLSDCGLQPSVLERFCCSDTSRICTLDSLRLNLDSTYSWS
ncbi:Protein downstream neighbor of son-like protein [Cryptotermes secundus]|uniref:Protein downstream neighbor of son-like protein n=1 Tax=Cryptotermes secundus TaxID=105785 RepID=A0A2J7QVR5_9NEOP|nr:protein downstream neighbor of son homolog [Cryptotermes secundus]XP_033607553.1 protein downstream neighbor of son homolog [Cryptotermes secundus]PNF32675.1 Protein downstream neighbor of son-like protein [Cryptotermes secundus]PNF32676.1 Protein downstream neighbor of son-like protein [Cryptotermes secundus]PNF32677.1 Protein downstream neighbor of son-like protein [Cryptotermes secundus]